VLPELHLVRGGWQLVVSLHGLAIAAGVAAGGVLAARRARAPALAAAAAVSVAALAGAHLLFRLLHGGPGEFWSGGLASTGGVAAGLAAAWATARVAGRHPLEVLDAIAPAGLLALGIGRLGCFLAGCCYGRPTDLPWGVIFPDLGPPARHPLQLYSAAADFALVLVLPGRTAAPGVVTRRACVAFGLVRAVLEILRDPGATDRIPGGWLTLPQGAALVLAGVAALSEMRLRRRRPSTMARRWRKAAHAG
jgi:phosphatidylglycerol:prolipoprotein diacylglycerol transferase